MQNSFDPYHQWLGIPRDEQPPNHYRLLGLRAFEADPNVVGNAADRVMMHLRALSIGPNGALAQSILNEVSNARVCLLNSEQRVRYDEALRESLRPEIPEPVPPAPAVRNAPLHVAPQPPMQAAMSQSLPFPSVSNSPPPRRHIATQRPRKSTNMGFEVAKVVIGGLLGLIIAQTILYYTVNVDVFGLMGRIHPRQAAPSVASVPLDKPLGQPSTTSPTLPTISPPQSPTPPLSLPTLPGGEGALPAGPDFSQPSPPTSLIPEVPSPTVPSPTNTTPKVTSPEPPPISSPDEILSRLPTSVDLPPLIDTAPRKFAPIGMLDIPELEMSLADANASIPDEAAIVVEKTTRRGEWSICFCPDSAESPPLMNTIATVWAKDDGLWFQWTTPLTYKEIRQQLRNCSLTVMHGKIPRRIALRAVKEIEPFVIDVSKPVTALPLDLVDLPSQERLQFRFSDLAKFSHGASWKNGVSSISLGKKAVIEFAEVEGARIELSIVKKSSDSLAVTMRPVFIEQLQPSEMTLTRLSKMEQDLPRQIEEDRASLQGYMSQHSTLTSQLSSVQSSSAANLTEANRRNQQLAGLQGSIQRVRSRISHLERRIPQLQSKLNVLPTMRSFLEVLHGKASIGFTIELDHGDHKSALVIAGGP